MPDTAPEKPADIVPAAQEEETIVFDFTQKFVEYCDYADLEYMPVVLYDEASDTVYAAIGVRDRYYHAGDPVKLAGREIPLPLQGEHHFQVIIPHASRYFVPATAEDLDLMVGQAASAPDRPAYRALARLHREAVARGENLAQAHARVIPYAIKFFANDWERLLPVLPLTDWMALRPAPHVEKIMLE